MEELLVAFESHPFYLSSSDEEGSYSAGLQMVADLTVYAPELKSGFLFCCTVNLDSYRKTLILYN